MSSDSTHRFGDQNAAQQRFLSPHLRGAREIFCYVPALIPNVSDVEEILNRPPLLGYKPTALEVQSDQ
jgi:hypothetical protein